MAWGQSVKGHLLGEMNLSLSKQSLVLFFSQNGSDKYSKGADGKTCCCHQKGAALAPELSHMCRGHSKPTEGIHAAMFQDGEPSCQYLVNSESKSLVGPQKTIWEKEFETVCILIRLPFVLLSRMYLASYFCSHTSPEPLDSQPKATNHRHEALS